MKLGNVRNLTREMLIQEYDWSANDQPVSQHEQDAWQRTHAPLKAEMARRGLLVAE